MMHAPIFIIADDCKLPLGNSTSENWKQMTQGRGSIRFFEEEKILPLPFQASKWTQFPSYETNQPATRLEKIIIGSIEDALKQCNIDPKDPEVIFIGATTKGNIDLLEKADPNFTGRERLHQMSEFIRGYFKNPNTSWMISNACISGVLALQTAHHLLEKGKYKHAIVFGGDLVSKFTLSGFNAFKAVSNEPCKPYDKNRSGISLGEGAACMILSTTETSELQMLSAATSNDANHISGPSRDGSGLKNAIDQTLKKSGQKAKPDFISTHGTATFYNDEMEALALKSCDLETIPLHSIKGYIGHTLGAAGLVETCILLESMRKGKAPATKGFDTLGVSVPINICKENYESAMNFTLKTASGFGGCNAAAAFLKHE